MSLKLKEIMKKILYLGNTLNQGTARGKIFHMVINSLFLLALVISGYLLSGGFIFVGIWCLVTILFPFIYLSRCFLPQHFMLLKYCS